MTDSSGSGESIGRRGPSAKDEIEAQLAELLQLIDFEKDLNSDRVEIQPHEPVISEESPDPDEQ